MQKLAVLGFSGEHGEAVAAALNSRLWDSEFYTLVVHSELDTVRWVSATESSSGLLSLDDLNAAHMAGIDGIVVGDVIAYRCKEQPIAQKKRTWGWRLQSDQQSPAEHGDGTVAATPGRKINHDATVTVAFRLLDVRTGKIRASRQISHSSTDVITARLNSSPSCSEVLEGLTRQCADEFEIGRASCRERV